MPEKGTLADGGGGGPIPKGSRLDGVVACQELLSVKNITVTFVANCICKIFKEVQEMVINYSCLSCLVNYVLGGLKL